MTDATPTPAPARSWLRSLLRIVFTLAAIVFVLWLIMPALYTDARSRMNASRVLARAQALTTPIAEYYGDRGSFEGVATAFELPLATGDWTGTVRWAIGADGSISAEGSDHGLKFTLTPIVAEQVVMGWGCRFEPREDAPRSGPCDRERLADPR